MTDFTTWPYIGGGSERRCYRNPDNPRRMVKLSPVKDAKQTLREIEYYEYLIKHQIPFDHIPKFYGTVRQDGYIGIEQEFVTFRPDSDEQAPTLGHYILQGTNAEQRADLNAAFIKLHDYLIKWNISLCDMQMSNVVVQEKNNHIHLMIIDGLGSTEVIPISRWFASLNLQKLERYWKKFNRKILKTDPTLRSCIFGEALVKPKDLV